MELYLHIPFCRQKCNYCDFVSFAGRENRMEAYIDTLLKEAEQQCPQVTETVETLYIGGGTPSLLPPLLLTRLISGLRSLFPVSPSAEFTVEANPGTLTPSWLDAAAASGINRMSLGMQAYQDSLLSLLGRIHRFTDVENSICQARKAGFRNLNLDLIFGLPNQTEQDWSETLARVLDLSVEHISAYGLIPEEGTPLARDLRAGRLALPSPEAEREMYEILKSKMLENGYEQYEISNFSKPGAACRHNIGYWTQVPYLGLGISSASMLDEKKDPDGFSYTRIKNPVTFEAYDHLVLEGDLTRRETEFISPREARFETMMLGLRMTRGVCASDFFRLHGVSLDSCYGDKLRSFQQQGLLNKRKDRWFLTSRGMDVQNAILVELMDD